MKRAAAVATTAAAGYLAGSVPTAVLVARRRGVDVRARGDRNPGYWNAKELLGRRAAAPVFAGDVVKGAAAALVGRALARRTSTEAWGIGYVGGAAAMVGHAWPVFAHFRGGRSVLTFVGAATVLSPGAAALAVGACAVVTAATGSFAYGARAGVFGFPVLQLLVERPQRVAATGGLMSIIGLRFALAAQAERAAVRANSGEPSGPSA